MSDNVTPLTPLSHASITSLSVNVAECEIQSIQKVYHIWAKLHYLLKVTEEARKTFRSFFEGFWNESLAEEVSLLTQPDTNERTNRPLLPTHPYHIYSLVFLVTNTRLYKPLFNPSVRRSLARSDGPSITKLFHAPAHPSTTNTAVYTAFFSLFRYFPISQLKSLMGNQQQAKQKQQKK